MSVWGWVAMLLVWCVVAGLLGIVIGRVLARRPQDHEAEAGRVHHRETSAHPAGQSGLRAS